MKRTRGRLEARLQALEDALIPSLQPSKSLWQLKGETVEEGIERYQRERIALASPFFPVFPSMSKEEWLEEFGGGEWAEARMRRTASTLASEGAGTNSTAKLVS